MIIHFIKFFHLLCTLGLLVATFYCFFTAYSGSKSHLRFVSKIILYLTLGAVLSGTLLIYPKHFTFRTHWIDAAYVLTGIFSLGIIFLKRTKNEWRWGYLILIAVLLFIVHDAVTKTSIL